MANSPFADVFMKSGNSPIFVVGANVVQSWDWGEGDTWIYLGGGGGVVGERNSGVAGTISIVSGIEFGSLFVQGRWLYFYIKGFAGSNYTLQVGVSF